MFSLKQFKPYLLILPFTALSLSAHADTRLNQIKQSGELRVGYIIDDFPFTYPHEQKPIGFAVDIVNGIATRLAKQQNVPDLKIIYETINLNNRFDLVNQGKADIACGSHSNTVERKAIVNFSNNFFLARSRLLAHKDAGIKTYADIKDKRIAVTKGALSESVMQSRRLRFGYHSLNAFEGYDDMVGSVVDGSNDVAIGDDVLLKSWMGMRGNGQDWIFVGPAVTLDRYACILPKDQPNLKKAVDEALKEMMLSGEMEALFTKWFQSEIDTPRGRANLHFEFSAAMQGLYHRPNDVAVGE